MFKEKRFIFGLLFVGFFFYFLFKNIDLNKLLEALAQFNVIWLIPALAIYLFGYVIRGFRWVILLNPIKKCSWNSLFPTLMIGFMVNNLLPARLGEFYRAHLNGKKENISRSSSLATIILERIFDGLAMLLILWAALPYAKLPFAETSTAGQLIHQSIQIASYLFGLAFIFLLCLIIFKAKTTTLISYFISHAPQKVQAKLNKIFHTFLEGLHALKSTKEVISVMGISITAWTCEFLAFYLMAKGFNLSPDPITLGLSALLMAITNLGLMVPSSPGGLGIFEFIGVTLLTPFAVGKELAFAYIFMVHLLVLIPVTLIGLIYFFKEGLSFNTIQKDS